MGDLGAAMVINTQVKRKDGFLAFDINPYVRSQTARSRPLSCSLGSSRTPISELKRDDVAVHAHEHAFPFFTLLGFVIQLMAASLQGRIDKYRFRYRLK